MSLNYTGSLSVTWRSPARFCARFNIGGQPVGHALRAGGRRIVMQDLLPYVRRPFGRRLCTGVDPSTMVAQIGNQGFVKRIPVPIHRVLGGDGWSEIFPI